MMFHDFLRQLLNGDWKDSMCPGAGQEIPQVNVIARNCMYGEKYVYNHVLDICPYMCNYILKHIDI